MLISKFLLMWDLTFRNVKVTQEDEVLLGCVWLKVVEYLHEKGRG